MGTSVGVFGAPLSSVPVPLSVGSVLLRGRRAPPPPHALARAPPRSALGPAYLSSGSHHFCNSPRPREFRSSPRPSPSPPMLQPSAKPDEPPSSVSGATTPSSRPEPQRSLRGPPRVCPYLGTLVHPGWDPEVPTHIPCFPLWGQGSHVLQSRATAYLNSRQLTSLSAIRRPLTLSGQIGPARTGRQKILLLRGHVSLSCLRPQRLRPTGLALFQVQKPSGQALPFRVSVPTVSAPRRPSSFQDGGPGPDPTKPWDPPAGWLLSLPWASGKERSLSPAS